MPQWVPLAAPVWRLRHDLHPMETANGLQSEYFGDPVGINSVARFAERVLDSVAVNTLFVLVASVLPGHVAGVEPG